MEDIKKIDDVIKELQELKSWYGNIECYNITFYVEQGENGKITLTV